MLAQKGSVGKVANSLVSASCAAVLAVYAAGYARTQKAASRMALQVAQHRRAAAPAVIPGPWEVANIRLLPPPPVNLPSAAVLNSARRAEDAPVDAPAPTSIVAEPPPPVAPAPEVAVEPAPAVPTPAAPTWKDGTYTGWGYSRHGNIEATVVIEAGRIASAIISQCRTRYRCDVIDRLPPEVAQRQSPDVDVVSGATQSADAFYGAVVEALGKAK
jgi:uncharacterized protein with FMN-binding domain